MRTLELEKMLKDQIEMKIDLIDAMRDILQEIFPEHKQFVTNILEDHVQCYDENLYFPRLDFYKSRIEHLKIVQNSTKSPTETA